MDKYEKICVEKNPDFSVYHGAGKYFSSKENTLLHCDTNLSISYMLQCSGNIKIEGKQYAIKTAMLLLQPPQRYIVAVLMMVRITSEYLFASTNLF